MKTKTPELVASVSAEPIKFIQLSWAKEWINVWSNGGIGYQGKRIPTKAEKADIRKRIQKAKELMKQKEKAFNRALELIG